MAELQEPKYVSWNGELIPWKEATLQIDCEGVKRGLNVFEGLKGYWHDDGGFGLIQVKRHYERFRESARLLYVPFEWTFERYQESIFNLMKKLLIPEKDMWIRTTLFGVEGHWGIDTKADMVMTAFNQNKVMPGPINLGISNWQRSMDVSLPYRIKTGANYQVGRLARIEGRQKNCQEMVLLNRWGRVAEATGACILMVRKNKIITPPTYEGALESITVDIAAAIARSLGIEFERRPIDKTELLIADEIAICGTLAEIVPVKSIEGLPLNPEGAVLEAVRNRFFDIVRGRSSHPEVNISFVPLPKTV